MAVGNAKRLYTAQDFEALALSPDNADRRLELIGGELTDVVSNVYASRLAARILGALVAYLEKSPLGDVTGADGGYCVGEDRYIPDVGYIARARQPNPPLEAAYNPLPPDLAVEVISPTDSLSLVMDKVVNYLAAGTLVWRVFPDSREVKVYTPGQPVKALGAVDTLDGSALLPGFTLELKKLFTD